MFYWSVCGEWCLFIFFFKQKTAYEMRISDWSSDVCSSDLTLTDGRPAFKEVVAFEGFDADQVLHLAASLDQGSEHPLADAIVAEARRRNFEFDRVEDFDSVTGMGVRGSVAGHELALGNTALMDDLGANPGAHVRSEEHTSELQPLMR